MPLTYNPSPPILDPSCSVKDRRVQQAENSLAKSLSLEVAVADLKRRQKSLERFNRVADKPRPDLAGTYHNAC